MSEVFLSETYIKDVLTPVSRSSKLPNTMMLLKDEASGDVFFTVKDTLGGSKLCIRASSEDIRFDDEVLRIKDMQKLLSYISMNNYPEHENSKLTRIDRRNIRNAVYPCIESSGAVGKFTVPLGVDSMFEEYNSKAMSGYDDPISDTTEELMEFSIDYEYITTLNNIASELSVEKFVIHPTDGDLKIFLKGAGDNQFTTSLPASSVKVSSIDVDGEQMSYIDEPDREPYLPFSITIINHLDMIGFDAVFKLVRHTKSGIYGLFAYAGYVDVAGKPMESSIRAKVDTTLNPNTLLSGDFTNVFDN
jgi:hypothetical protein